MVVHLHSDLLAVTRRVTEIVGSDRVVSSTENSHDGTVDMVLDDLQAVDEFAAEFDVTVDVSARIFGESRSSQVVVNGITTHVTAVDFTAVAS